MINASKAIKISNKSRQKVLDHIWVNLEFRIRHDAENGLYESVITIDEKDFYLKTLVQYSLLDNDIWADDILPVLDSEGYDANIDHANKKLTIIWDSFGTIL